MNDDDVTDTIERSVRIDAPVETVWRLVSEPGWWINAGTVVPHEVRDEGDQVVVVDPDHGEFRLRVVALDPPRRARFEWLDDDASTAVEFTVSEEAGEVVLTVVESGLASLPGGPQERARRYRDNVEGWRTELDAARRFCASVP